jgi:iron uptake system EfeUOB component EfeO/EfeM
MSSIQSITFYIKNAEAKGEDVSPLKTIMMNVIKKNLVELDKSINEYQAKKQLSESDFKKFYIMVNNIYENLYNNNKFNIFSYNIEHVKEAEKHFKNPQLIDENKAVTITTTTCKRTDLITRTIDSFLECVLDYKKYVKQDQKHFRPEELNDLKGDSSKLRNNLGWNPKYTFESMIDEMIEYWLNFYTEKK